MDLAGIGQSSLVASVDITDSSINSGRCHSREENRSNTEALTIELPPHFLIYQQETHMNYSVVRKDNKVISDESLLSRRRYLTLSAVSGAVLIAGCSEDGGDGGSGSNSSGSSTTRTSTEPTTTNGATIRRTETRTESETQTQTRTSTETETQTETETETATETATETTSGGSASAFGPEEFTGSGTETVGEFQLTTAPITAEFSHDGSSNFIVDLIALEGDSLSDVSLINAIGDVEGSQVRRVSEEGMYALNADADGDWSVTLNQPANPSTESLPISEDGESLTYLGPFEFDGPVEFQASHDGSSNFIVESVPLESGTFGNIIFNEVGSFDGSTTARINDVAYLNIRADGEWSLQTN